MKFLASQEAENEFAVPGDNLKHRFINLTEFAFSVGQEEENDFKVPWDYLKHRFINFILVEFWS